MVFTSWVIVEPAGDIPGVWMAHCLLFDVLSQGTSPTEALEAVGEAMMMTIVDDPSERRAPDEGWERLVDILLRGKRVQVPEVSASSRAALAIEMTVVFRQVRDGVGASLFMLPLSQAVVDLPCETKDHVL